MVKKIQQSVGGLGMRKFFCLCFVIATSTACVQHSASYTPPEAAGLVGGQAYPSSDDVCQVLGESPATTAYSDGSDIIIGCPSHEMGAIGDRQSEGAKILDTVGNWTVLKIPEPQTQSDAEKVYAGYTLVYYDSSHGTQVEYYLETGVSFLWYPGNRVILRGDWKVERGSNRQNNLCHRYPTNSYNPVTKVRGGNWECSNLALQQNDIQNRIVGDPFDLRSGKVPFVFERRKQVRLSELAQKAGLNHSNLIDRGRP